ncbi:IclR family transcriptional regulator [Alkaliphilus peptidifermentans]|uniref:Glycerol operon regulatory protein n=1 Tax=Alkaliphilus peptidifermentans DSM 18978 TaxID=1120976 RepID=A0A1G5F537_9FIRM|nr:IclR family transcriptional regulator [Alkaliphilus peptidifermentans]SCY34010.1 transcriptional regulator, IclR family [Alkaliphilus peptidifermentans DSM 18978]
MKDIVQSVDRTLSILEVLSDYQDGLGITDLSGKINLHKSTVHRLLATLIHKGYVIQDNVTNKYQITFKLFELGNKRLENIDLFSVAKPFLKELMSKTNEVVHLVIREGNEIVYIDKVESENTIRMFSKIGRRSPLYCTAVGKAILAQLPEEEIERIWNNSVIEKFTDHTIITIEEMKKELQEIRKKEYAVDEQENELGVRCVGAVVFNHTGEVAGAISISGPTIRVTKEKASEFSKLVIMYSKMISKELGYRG